MLRNLSTSLRNLFSTILAYCNPVNPRQLFLTFEEAMVGDLIHTKKLLTEAARQTLLTILKSLLESMGKNIRDYNLFDLFSDSDVQNITCKEILDEQNLEISEA